MAPYQIPPAILFCSIIIGLQMVKNIPLMCVFAPDPNNTNMPGKVIQSCKTRFKTVYIDNMYYDTFLRASLFKSLIENHIRYYTLSKYYKL